jgi:hypothetical protein
MKKWIVLLLLPLFFQAKSQDKFNTAEAKQKGFDPS